LQIRVQGGVILVAWENYGDRTLQQLALAMFILVADQVLVVNAELRKEPQAQLCFSDS
jgi:hypothetical protein